MTLGIIVGPGIKSNFAPYLAYLGQTLYTPNSMVRSSSPVCEHLVAVQRYTDLIERRPKQWLPWSNQETVVAIQAHKRRVTQPPQNVTLISH